MRLFICGFAVFALVACGGQAKEAPAPEAQGPRLKDTTSPYENVDEVKLPPEKLDEINLALKKREGRAGRCHSKGLQAGEVAPNASGYITVGVTFTVEGKASQVEVVESTLKAPSVEKCLVEEVGRAAVSALPEPFKTSYTFRFERDY